MEMMKKRIGFLSIFLLLVLALPGAASARQEGQVLGLSLVRNFGYGGLGRIQGNFTLKVQNPPAQLEEVRFLMDGELMEVVSTAPFQTKFHTSDFSDGDHQMSAQGILADGSLLESSIITKTFLSSDQAWSETQQIIIPLLVGVAVLTALGLAVPALLGRKKEHVPGNYGLAGGAVCPRCGLPFSRPYLAPNLMVGKLVRCPHCGKISILPAASPARLQEAEGRYAGETEATSPREDAGDIEKLIEDSRFEE